MSRSEVVTGNVPGSMTLRAFEADLLSRENRLSSSFLIHRLASSSPA